MLIFAFKSMHKRQYVCELEQHARYVNFYVNNFIISVHDFSQATGMSSCVGVAICLIKH